MVCVQFYGDLTTAHLSRKNIQPFTLNMKITSQKKLLIKAIKDANEEFVKMVAKKSVEKSNGVDSSMSESKVTESVAVNRRNDMDHLKALRLEFEKEAKKIPDVVIL